MRIGCDRNELDVALIDRFLSGAGRPASRWPPPRAHGLHAQLGFTSLMKPQAFMARYRPAIYRSAGQSPG